ncbi:oligopeptide/dipeptide ABC transporter, ATPase subunit [Thermoanaerobacter italicus Ab9]|uniref:Oligopeptide/dipeptide ABC transporter, ATPase subunit n=1 Tax=Thermoanaerobacter italicus (strain DSM 9252 / Ab9) TaxID=580331 RepID=D3T6M0_THEIA|nr:ABC transporter ATP-binding protein [Thermoanaerobacter italicus]ADD01633.1 oligopeptide/dipeptide ABC transporter, ATPase subunit [Thermoanaerobacter italicus Ab9]
MIKAKNLTKIFNSGFLFTKNVVAAVDDVNFEIGKGEILALVGESGSGKSTIGKMMLKLLKPSGGQILLDDKDIWSLSNNKEFYSRVQGIFQDPFSSFNPIFKVNRVFKLVRQSFKKEVPAAEWNDRVENVLKKVGLNAGDVLNKYIHQLSGGQLQRLLIARALLMDVEVLVADEITSMLDASTRVDVLEALLSLKEIGAAIMFITHDLSQAYYISDKIVVLYRGSVVEMGSIEKVFSNPRHPYTQMLLDSIPQLDRKWETDKFDIEDSSKNQTIWKEGFCKYVDRCPIADTTCINPPLKLVEEDHYVACAKL